MDVKKSHPNDYAYMIIGVIGYVSRIIFTTAAVAVIMWWWKALGL